MSAPTPILELCDKATPGPWKATKFGDFGVCNVRTVAPGFPVAFTGTKRPNQENEANAELIARLSPEVVRKVYQALKAARNCGELPDQEFQIAGNAIAMLDGTETP